MSKQVDFYLIANAVSDAKYKLASRLSNKLLKLKQKTLIVTDGPEATKLLNQWLWSFSGTSFVAHDSINTSESTSIIHISDENSLSDHDLQSTYAVMINLCESVPTCSHHFQRIAEIIEAQDEQKASGRARYTHYRDKGYELKMHQMEL